jgi:hypothetical protein
MATSISNTLATEGVNMEGLGRMRVSCKFAGVPSFVVVYMFSHTDERLFHNQTQTWAAKNFAT